MAIFDGSLRQYQFKIEQQSMFDWLFGNSKKKQQPKKKEEKPKKSQSKAQKESEDKWKYDFLVQFLNSPLWRVTILDFVDTKCIVFDSEEENKFEYTLIHNEFKQIVANMFDGMMQEIGVDGEELLDLIERGFQSKEKKLFHQLLYCDDFLKFKDLMLRRNRALEQEALKDMERSKVHKKSKIERERELIHSSKMVEENRRKKQEQEEQEMLRKALEISKIQAEERNAIERLEEKAIAAESSKKLENQMETKGAERNQQLQKEQQEAKLREAEQQREEEQQKRRRDQQRKKQLRARLNKKKGLDPIAKPANQQTNLKDLPPIKEPVKKIEEPQKREEEQPQETTVQEPPQIQEPVKKQEPKVENQEDRKKRLLEQREKIRRKKQEERKRMLEDQEPSNKVMNIVLQDQGIHDSVRPQPKEPEEKVSSDEVQRRKQLMKRIKNRIVDDF